MAKRVIAALAKMFDFMIRTRVTQLVKENVLPVVRRVIAALAKKCRLCEQNKYNSAGKSKCSSCGEEGHRCNSKKCQLYEHNKSNSSSAGKKKPIWKDSDDMRELKSIFLDDKDKNILPYQLSNCKT